MTEDMEKSAPLEAEQLAAAQLAAARLAAAEQPLRTLLLQHLHSDTLLTATQERDLLRQLTDGLPPQDADDMRQLYQTLLHLNRRRQSPLSPEAIALEKAICAAAHAEPHKLPDTATVACQGAEGAYAQIACDRLFPQAQILYMRSFSGVVRAVESGMCAYGVLPVENNVHGSVGAVYDLMREHRFFIVRAMRLPVRHILAVKPGVSEDDIREILSHEQAIGQCQEFLKAHPDVQVTVCRNTAVAAQTVADSDRRDMAAICSAACCGLYGLQALCSDIQDSDNNHTRFLCLSKDLQLLEGLNKMSIQFRLTHRPGALSEVIARIAGAGLNLSKLESRPIPGRDFEFQFYADLEGDCREQAVIRMLQDLTVCTEQLQFLGGYAELS